MTMLRLILLSLALALCTYGQNLREALSKFPELSNFTAFYANNDALANSFFGNQSLYPVTFLAPNNKAFAGLQSQFGTNMTNVPIDALLALVQYHTLVSNLTKQDFGNGGTEGITVPTMLNNARDNNRSVGVSMASRFGGEGKAAGQVVFIKGDDSGSPGRFRLMSRENNGGQPDSSVRSGLSSNVGILPIEGSEGVWDGGRFHIVDGLLTPPTTCASTIRAAGLVNLDLALNRSSLWSALDGSKNITCLGPSNDAFINAGNPQSVLNESALTGALLFHTLPEVAYSDYLYDGQEFRSLQNFTVRVSISGESSNKEIRFNNAKVVEANVL